MVNPLCNCDLYIRKGYEDVCLHLENVILIEGFTHNKLALAYGGKDVISVVCSKHLNPFSTKEYWIIFIKDKKVIHNYETIIKSDSETFDFVKLVIS